MDIASDVVDDSDLSSDDTNVVEIDSDPPDMVSSEDEDEMDKVMMCGPCRPGDSLLQQTNCRDASCKDPKTVMLDMTKNEVKSFRVDSMRSGKTRQSVEKRRGRSAARAALPVHEQRKRRRSPGPARYLADTGSAYDLIAKGDLTAKDRKNIKKIMEDITLFTASGCTKVKKRLMMRCKGLGERIQPLLLDSCPPVISIGRRCVKYGYEFHWKPYSSAPAMVKSNGERITFFFENYIPYVPNPDYDQSSNVKASKAAPATASIMPM